MLCASLDLSPSQSKGVRHHCRLLSRPRLCARLRYASRNIFVYLAGRSRVSTDRQQLQPHDAHREAISLCGELHALLLCTIWAMNGVHIARTPSKRDHIVAHIHAVLLSIVKQATATRRKYLLEKTPQFTSIAEFNANCDESAGCYCSP